MSTLNDCRNFLQSHNTHLSSALLSYKAYNPLMCIAHEPQKKLLHCSYCSYRALYKIFPFLHVLLFFHQSNNNVLLLSNLHLDKNQHNRPFSFFLVSHHDIHRLHNTLQSNVNQKNSIQRYSNVFNHIVIVQRNNIYTVKLTYLLLFGDGVVVFRVVHRHLDKNIKSHLF